MNTDILRALYDYHYYARDLVWGCVMKLDDEQYRRKSGYSLGSIHELSVHLIAAEAVWLARLKGTSPSAMLNAGDYPTRETVIDKWRSVEAEFRAYLATLTDADLTRDVNYQSIAGKAYHNPVWATLMQVINHGTDHRAQILMMIHQLGGETLEPDLIFYVRNVRQT